MQTDLNDPAMLLMLDYEVFYEFIPMDEYGQPDARILPLWETEVGVDYALITMLTTDGSAVLSQTS